LPVERRSRVVVEQAEFGHGIGQRVEGIGIAGKEVR
jgi:hypothetical protein